MQSLIIMLLATCLQCTAQVPQTITVQVYLETNGNALNGQHDITTRWYDAPVGGSVLFVEAVNAEVVEGIATLHVGSVLPLPDTLFRRGSVWLGFSIDGAPELLPRTVLASVPYALVAERSLVAESLSPEVTGVVTSINEIAGNVEVRGGGGIKVQRDGRSLIISHSGSQLYGRIEAAPGKHIYKVELGTPLPPNSMICATVHANTFVGINVDTINAVTGEFTLVASAPLDVGEWIEWKIQ